MHNSHGWFSGGFIGGGALRCPNTAAKYVLQQRKNKFQYKKSNQ